MGEVNVPSILQTTCPMKGLVSQSVATLLLRQKRGHWHHSRLSSVVLHINDTVHLPQYENIMTESENELQN